MNIKQFLQQPSIQKLLQEGDLKSIYVEYNQLPYSSVSNLSKFFINIGVDPLLYMHDIISFMFCGTPIESVTIPSNIEAIYEAAFLDCTHLRDVIICDGPSFICRDVFNNCSILESIHLPKSLRTINPNAFRDCPMLRDVYYDGTELDKEELFIDYGNEALLNATWHFNK